MAGENAREKTPPPPKKKKVFSKRGAPGKKKLSLRKKIAHRINGNPGRRAGEWDHLGGPPPPAKVERRRSVLHSILAI